ncbi:MAG TPA: hypothetical protein VGB79_06380 [Allosphingosinicella sp.]
MFRFLHFLALLAMMLAPMAMHGAPAAAAAPAHHAVAEAPHCAGSGEGQDERERGRSADCAIACSAMTGGSQLAEPAAPPRADFLAALNSFVAGTAPGSDPPPPRLA